MLNDSLRMQFPDSEIRKVEQFRFGGPPPIKKLKPYQFREKGLFNATTLGIMPFYDGLTWVGISFSHVVGHQFSRTSGLGLGFGFNKFGWDNDLTVVPIFLDFRGYFLKRNDTPYFDIRVGHGFAVDVDGTFFGALIDKSGGAYVSPNFGYRFGADKDINCTIDFGVQIQRGGFVASDGAGGRIERTLLYRRFSLRFGLLI